jgi:hypothetical protein
MALLAAIAADSCPWRSLGTMSAKRVAVHDACSKLDHLYGGQPKNRKAGEHVSTGFSI